MRTLTSSSRKRHLGVDFEIWGREGAWFWLIINSRGEGEIIGASANEAQAMRDACLSIEEKLTSFDSELDIETRNLLKTTTDLAHVIRKRRY
jgi:hypothetical protein